MKTVPNACSYHDRFRLALRNVTLATAVFLSLVAPSTAAEPIRIVLSVSAAVDDDVIRLGDVADISGGVDGQADALSSIEIGRSPFPGQSLLLHSAQIEMRLRQQTADFGPIRITAAGPVRVLRNHLNVAPERIAEVVRDFIVAHAPWDPEQMIIRPIQYSQSHRVPPGDVSFQVSPPKHLNWLGAVPFRVNIRVDGRTVQRVSVPAYIEVWQDVVLAAKPLGRDQPITADDIKIETMNIARIPSAAILRADQAIGRRANRSIAVNSVLRSDQVERPPVIRRGDVVQVLAESDALRITTQAVAQENGAFGETIRVMNMRSRKQIHALVVNAQMVRVEF